jgi:hypothetical protein
MAAPMYYGFIAIAVLPGLESSTRLSQIIIKSVR